MLERRDELLQALATDHRRTGSVLSALMVTDILEKATDLLVAGDGHTLEQAFGERPREGVLHLPGVMSRKKQVAPKLMGAAGA